MKVGSLVECINNSYNNSYSLCLNNGMILPKKNKIYTIRGFHPINNGLYLEEINNAHCSRLTNHKKEPAFSQSRFLELLPPVTIELEEILNSELQHD